MKPTADYRVTPSGLQNILMALIQRRRPVMVWGEPGIGKTEIGKLVAKMLSWQYLDIRAPLLDPTDLRGIPRVDEDNFTTFAVPKFFPQDRDPHSTLICFDELPNAPRMTQNALYQITLDRRCGEYFLPDHCAVIACGNREEDNSGAERMSTALASRFMHVDLKVSVQEWSEWAIDNDIKVEVIYFIHFMQDYLHKFDPEAEEYAYPCPRTWEFVSQTMDAKMDDRTKLVMLRGTVGEQAATHFMNFLKVWKSLPHPDTIINNPKTAPVPTDPSTLIALCGALYRRAEDDTTFDSIVEWARRIPRKDVAQFLVNSCVQQNKELEKTQTYIGWITKKNAK